MPSVQDVINVERGEIGYSRWNDPQTGTKYGRWYAQKTGESWYGGNGVAYCAMFQTYCFDNAGVTCAGLPGAYCPNIVNAVRKAGVAVSARDAKPGDIVLFDWNGDGVADHIGLVEVNTGSHLQTIEGNTNNGVVARRTRAYGTAIICGRPNYGGASKPTQPSHNSGLAVDGIVGPATVRRWQQVMGTPIDGVISGQYSGNRKYCSAITAINYTNVGSALIRAVQRTVGTYHDGYLGPDTIRHIQQRLGVAVDGYFGPNTARALQSKLNAGGF